MKAVDRGGKVIKTNGYDFGDKDYKSEVRQTTRMLFARGYSDWVNGNNFVKAIFHGGILILRMGAGKNRVKEIDINRDEAVRLAKQILIEYEDTHDK